MNNNFIADDIKLSNTKRFAICIGLFSYYAGEWSIYLWFFSAVFLTLLIRCTRNWFLGFVFALSLFFLLRFVIDIGFIELIIRDLRFFWGFLPFLAFFISENKKYQNYSVRYENFFRKLINIFILLLLIEYITSNFFSYQWINRSHDLLIDMQDNQTMARAYGFGGNATVTSVLLISLCSLIYPGKIIRDFLTLMLATSGTGFIVFLIKFLFKNKLKYLFFYTFSILLILLLIFQYFNTVEVLENYPALMKFAIPYFMYLIDYKIEQYQIVMQNTSTMQFFLGQPFTDFILRTGDFQALDFMVFNGLIGIFLFLCVLLKFLNKKNFIPLILLLIGTMHYQVIFSIPGQILFSWLLTIGINFHQKKEKNIIK